VVFTYHALFSAAHAEEIRAGCLSGGRGCVLCKNELAASMESFLEPIREKRAALEKNIDFVKDVIREGTARGCALTDDMLRQAKLAMRIDYGDIFSHSL
jgi:tryptophanyl-tRNA synthetase